MILLFSGGIDSYVAWHFLNKPPTVYFNLHTPYSEKETKVVQKLIPTTRIETCLNLGGRQVGEKAYIPYRNLYLALLANSYSDTIVIAGLKDDMVDDKNIGVFALWSALMSEMMQRKIEVLSPFWKMTKEDVVRWYLGTYSGDPNTLQQTISCYSEEDTNYCGKCPSCFRKWNALFNNGILIGFWNKGLMDDYYEKAKSKHYIKERCESIIVAVDRFRKMVWGLHDNRS